VIADGGGVVESLANKRKDKRQVRLTILFLGAMLGILVVAGGVALAAANYYYCPDATTCNCPKGVVCVGTPGEDRILGTDYGDTIYAKGGPDGVYPGGGDDYVDGGPQDDYIEGDDPFTSGNDTLLGGDHNDDIYGDKGDDKCYGGSGVDYLDPATCEERKQY
jgi:hypothetical protein